MQVTKVSVTSLHSKQLLLLIDREILDFGVAEKYKLKNFPTAILYPEQHSALMDAFVMINFSIIQLRNNHHHISNSILGFFFVGLCLIKAWCLPFI